LNINNLIKYILKNYEYNKNNGKLYYKIKIAKRVKLGTEAGYNHHSGYRDIKIKDKIYRLHRIIWLLENGHFPVNQIDHINGIKNDNRIINLRDVNNRFNCSNKKNNKKIIGVYKNKNNGWYSKIRFKKYQIHLGTYKTEKNASNQYLKARKIIIDGDNKCQSLVLKELLDLVQSMKM